MNPTFASTRREAVFQPQTVAHSRSYPVDLAQSSTAHEASVALMKQQGIVDSGEALKGGIGAMSDARIKDFYEQMVKAGLYKPGEVDLSKVATLQFVNKRVGMDIKTKLAK